MKAGFCVVEKANAHGEIILRHYLYFLNNGREVPPSF